MVRSHVPRPMNNSAATELTRHTTIGVLDGELATHTYRGLGLSRFGDAPLYSVPGWVDAHRHFPHGWAAEPDDDLVEARAQALIRLKTEGVAAARDMGLGIVAPWPDRTASVRSAVAGVRDEDNPDPVRFGVPATERDIGARVEEVIAGGADFIKLFVTGSGRRPRAAARLRRMSTQQIKTAAAVSQAAGIPVVAHCHGGPALVDCLTAGVESIEHGLYLTRDEVNACKQANAAITLTPGVYQLRFGLAIDPHLRRLVEDVLEAGVLFRVGTDTPDESLAQQIQRLIALGVPSIDAIRAAAANTAASRFRILFRDNPALHPEELTMPVGIGELQ